MNERLRFFSKLYKFNEDCDSVNLNSERGLLLDFTDNEWFGDKNKGLAQYLRKPIYDYVKYIRYHYAKGGYVEFDVLLNINKDTIVEGKTLEKYIKDFISGQISDGWGENGIYIVESGWIGDDAVVCNAETNLINYTEYRKLIKEE